MNIRVKPNTKIESPEELYEIMQRILKREQKTDRDREHFWTISLNNANTVLNIELVSMGSVNATIIEPMEVYSIPLQKRATRIILVHNHPAGTLKPSESDKDITNRLIQAGRILHIEVLDHIIITEESFYSFSQSGLLEELEKSLEYVPAYEIKAQGKEEGQQEKAKEMVKAMKKENVDIETIIRFTGLSKAEITKLQ
ncbi:DNA repair protein RadC [Aquimarina sp. MAR_2010_214]|uniref:JAB domain-containing protein n=1 Tax=Aquimarina sp. MAR_2010_214 TaxID=1250026 RepID=UPI000C6FFEDC|nr:JAB domain-containing protein [Aquimarina sp. MAR_2010_214]PKV52458.1 DNA repair protein RadC [Aquimarina sp. MAR_2010_214]